MTFKDLPEHLQIQILYNWDRFAKQHPGMAKQIGEQFDIPAYFSGIEKAVGGFLLPPAEEEKILGRALSICPKTAAVKGYYYGWKNRN